MARKKEFTKAKKKKWIEVIAPDRYHKQVMGESYVEDATNLLNRKLKVNLMTLTRDIKKQSITAQFEIFEIKENKAFTKIIGFDMINAALRRLVRRRRDKIASSVLMESKDGIKFRIKPITITLNRCSKSTQTDIRHAVVAKFKEAAALFTFENFVYEILANKIQRGMKPTINKIAPIRFVEVKAIKVE